MGMVLQLSLAAEDEEGWTDTEVAVYDGWGHDSGRTWNLAREAEGFRNKWGGSVVTLGHRFYLHLDNTNQLWLSAEDGCEGRLVDPGEKKKLFGIF